MGVTFKDAWRRKRRSPGKWQEGTPSWGREQEDLGAGGWGLRGSSGLGTSEVTGNFGESNVSWGHAEYRSQNAEGEDRKEGREIMNFDGEKDYREYLKDEGRRKILVSF